MAEKVIAKNYVGAGFPPEEGAKFARVLLSKETDWNDLTIDVRDLPASLIISAFFNGFLQRIFNERPAVLPQARRIKWELAYPFQQENVARWMKDFEPYRESAQPQG